MPTVSIFHTVFDVGISPRRLERVADRVLRALGFSRADISIHCIGETKMRRLNRTFRGSDRPTDVLSFGDFDRPQHGHADLGDIFLCIPYIRRQARRCFVSYEEELFRMCIHGILHALHYDHDTKKKAATMFALQEKFLKKFV